MKIIFYLLIIIGCYLFGKNFYANINDKLKLFCELKDFHNDFVIILQMYETSIKNYYLNYKCSNSKIISEDIKTICKNILKHRNISISELILRIYKDKQFKYFNDFLCLKDIEIICGVYKTIEISEKAKAEKTVKNLAVWFENRISNIKEKELTKVNLIKKTSVLVGILLVLLMI